MLDILFAIIFIITMLYLISKHSQKKWEKSQQSKALEQPALSEKPKLSDPPQLEQLSDEIHVDEKAVNIPKTPGKTKIVKFKIAGCDHYKDAIESLKSDNYMYDMSKDELYYQVDFYEKVYKYDFDTSDPKLIPEPDNEFDPNAVAVYVCGKKIGYIKKGSCSRVKNLMKKDLIKGISVNLYNGPYKQLIGDYEDLQIERSNTEGYFGDVELFVEVENAE